MSLYEIILAIGPLLFLGLLLKSICWAASFFIVPVAAIWSMELNADDYAATMSAHRADLQPAITSRSRPDILSLISISALLRHPPRFLRLWFMSEPLAHARLTLSLLVVPLAYILRLAFLFGWARIPSFLPITHSMYVNIYTSKLLSDIEMTCLLYLPVCAVTILSWPWIASHIFATRSNNEYRSQLESAPYVDYTIVAAIVLILDAILWLFFVFVLHE